MGLSLPPSPVSQPCPSDPRAGDPRARGSTHRVHVLQEEVHSQHRARHGAQSQGPGQQHHQAVPQALGAALGVGAGASLHQQLLQESSDRAARPTLGPEQGSVLAAGPRGVMDKAQGWGLGCFALLSSSTFSWVQMFSHCSFTERLWITLKSQVQKTLMANSSVELRTLSRKERDTLQRGEGHQGLGLGEGEGWQCHRRC